MQSFLRTITQLPAHTNDDLRMAPDLNVFATSLWVVSSSSGQYCRCSVARGVLYSLIRNNQSLAPLHARTMWGLTENSPPVAEDP